ncbi:DUF3095 domain-containing protein [Aestuariispira ectoiniformans]|uniref:DUF3095 domain-containing protein n=1 Tax=Aestuariispira ectoiniformans TaxID=2775080 RepID=UPI00223B9263|nr:DUF3095 domain-containing protein [Aestuariispira ectoiniformans]
MSDSPEDKNNNFFYQNIPAFEGFSGVTLLSNYHSTPDSWHIVIADVVNSTRAIEQGRYKDVNMIGAASITAVLNVTSQFDIPYVFGGDGATLLVPPSAVQAVETALAQLQNLADRQLRLKLRVGHTSIHNIRSLGHDILVSKLALSPNNHLAMFTGGGIAAMDRLLKENSPDITILHGDEGQIPPDLSGLSCRWEPLEAVRGTMLSILINPLGASTAHRTQIVGQVLEDLAAFLSEDLEQRRPTSETNMRLRWPLRNLWLEAIMTRGSRSSLRRYLGVYVNSLIQKFLDIFNLKLGDFNAPVYRNELRANTDFRRYDDTLRLILDCSRDEAARIEDLLESYRSEGRISYGLHISSRALMTCLVFSLSDHRHIHFIDGADGGFALAAKKIKDTK